MARTGDLASHVWRYLLLTSNTTVHVIQVLLQLQLNPDADIVDKMPSRKYVARAMQLGRPLPRFKTAVGTVRRYERERRSGFVVVQRGAGEEDLWVSRDGVPRGFGCSPPCASRGRLPSHLGA
jgi:hypothetical protein